MSPVSIEKDTTSHIASSPGSANEQKSKQSNPNSPAIKPPKTCQNVPISPSPVPSNNSQTPNQTPNQHHQNTTKTTNQTPSPPSQTAQPTSTASIIKSVLSNLNNQRKLRQFTDTIIIVENESFHLHRCLLAANSEYFVQLFKAVVPQNSVYVLLNVSKKAFEVVVEFIYTGGFSLKKENVHEVFHASKLLGIVHVLQCCKKVLKQIGCGETGQNGNVCSENGKPGNSGSSANFGNAGNLGNFVNSLNSLNSGNSLQKQQQNSASLPSSARQVTLSALSSLQAQLAGINGGVTGSGLPNALNSNSNSNSNSILNNDRALSLSMHNSLLPLEVQQVFLNQIANGKLGNANTSKALRKDAAILAKQIEQQVKEQALAGEQSEPEPLLTRKRKAGEPGGLNGSCLAGLSGGVVSGVSAIIGKGLLNGVKEEWRPEEMYEDLVNASSVNGEVEDDESNDVNVENELHEELMKIAELRKRRKMLSKKD